jgi:hypothetical protein
MYDINQEKFKEKTKDFFTSKYNKTLFGINKEIKEKNHLEIVNEKYKFLKFPIICFILLYICKIKF